MPVGSTRRIW